MIPIFEHLQSFRLCIFLPTRPQGEFTSILYMKKVSLGDIR